jgi:hypothetical protein
MYYTGAGIQINSEEAAKWFRKAAEQGHSLAQKNIGVMYYAGIGVGRDLIMAASWFRKAALQGDGTSQLGLGKMYFNAEGMKHDLVLAYAWMSIGTLNGELKAKQYKQVYANLLEPDQIDRAEALVKEMVKKNPKLIRKKTNPSRREG